MHPPRVIYIFGVDGAGKSTICRELIRALEKSGVRSKYLWLRFNHFLSKIVNAFGHLLGLAFYVTYPDGTRVGYHHYHKSRLLSLVYSISTLLDTCGAAFFKIWIPLRVGKEVLVLDRFVYDVMVDLSIDTGNLGLIHAWQGRLLRRMLPRNAVTFYLCVGPEVIAQRRPDTQWDENFPKRHLLYDQIQRDFPEISRMNNDGDMRNTLSSIMGVVTGEAERSQATVWSSE